MSAPIYLDYAATTPTDPAVARAMGEVLGAGTEHGNAGSITHVPGRRAKARVEEARGQAAALIGAGREDIVFTSGATESNNLALLGLARANADRGRHLITSRIEHKAVLDPCRQLEREGFTVTYLPPDRHGSVSPDAVRAALRADTVLVSVMHVNNEIGVIQDVGAIGELCREHNVPFHTDAAQAAGKLPIDLQTLPVDLLSFTAHKLYGPQGVGALYVRPQVRPLLRPITFGGGQERGLRPGTLPLHQIVGFGVACELAREALAAEPAMLGALRDRLWAEVKRLGGVHLNGEAAPRLPGILNVSFEGVEGESLVTALTSLAVTTGSACSSGSGEPSYVLRALGRDTQLAQSSLRFSVGRRTTERDIDAAAAAVAREVTRLRRLSPASATHLRAAAHAAGQRAAAELSAAQTSAAPATSRAPDPQQMQGVAVSRVSSSAQDPGHFDTLSPLARRYFALLPGAALTPDCDAAGAVAAPTSVTDGVWPAGEAGSVAEGTWVRFHLRIEQGIVKAALFQAYGCPHTLAVTAWITEQLPGRAAHDLVPGTPAAWLQALAVPMEKLGRLLIVEDALKAILQDRTSPA